MDKHSQKVLNGLLSQYQLTESKFKSAQDQFQAGLDSAASGLAAVHEAVAATTATLEHHTAQIREILHRTQMRNPEQAPHDTQRFEINQGRPL